ncbi:PREDICTED: LOW QUALITY PROTEIN: probable E3 SUMO-protein ligase RNF212 [Cercocebus atys]|uniref:LOW QUALITY PROTEIN: probable E3 SUMO-protein ligase RNF212 n=1 Tax=Cercocebus atys TaxID=9531 RepID=UPI0005F3D744|nr:PREDICTED: LOW QUALITY PROTEIN: probable E3 SUMO-protein ligase RNF212 [Cercocebus atys]
MANWVFCNRCFQPPQRTSCFSLTNCGHVYCDACLGKGQGRVTNSTPLQLREESSVDRARWCPHVRLCLRASWTQLLCTGIGFLQSLRPLLCPEGLSAYQALPPSPHHCPALPSEGSGQDEGLTVLLIEATDADIQAFFMSIGSLCKKYSRETSQVSEFQEKHRRRLLAFYREKISRLEESLRKSVLQIEQLQSMRSSQQTTFSTIKSSVSTKPYGCLLPPHSSTPDRLESMEVDLSPSPIRKSEIAAGPARISVISPPQDGRMGPHLTASFCFIPWLTLSKPPVPRVCVVCRGSPCFCIDVRPHWMLLLAFSSGRHREHTNSLTLPICAEVHRAALFLSQQAEGTLDTFRTLTVSVVFPLCQCERK